MQVSIRACARAHVCGKSVALMPGNDSYRAHKLNSFFQIFNGMLGLCMEIKDCTIFTHNNNHAWRIIGLAV